MKKDILRHVDLDGYTLKTWDTGRTARSPSGASILGYELKDPHGKSLFKGEDFTCSPLHAVDSDECVEALLGFLTLRPGDTDREYFKDYTKAQMEFANGDAEQLQQWAMTEREGRPPYKEVREARERKAPASSKEVSSKLKTIDQHALTELELYAENKSSIYEQKKSILKNILRRIKNGTYDPGLAPKLWLYWVDEAAKRYVKEFGGDLRITFPKPLREALAEKLAKEEYALIQAGEYESLKS